MARIGMTVFPTNGGFRLVRCSDNSTVVEAVNDEERKQIAAGNLRLRKKGGNFISLDTPVVDGLELELVPSDKKTDAIHLGREFLESSAKQAAADDEKAERAAKLKQIEENTRAKMEKVFQVPGVFVSQPPDLSAGDPEFEKRFQEILNGIPPSPKKGDKISRRQIAESIARGMPGHEIGSKVSEEELQKAYAWMDWNEKWRKAERIEKRFRIPAFLLLAFACSCILVYIAWKAVILPGSLIVLAFLFAMALEFWAEVRMEKRVKKFKSENPEPGF